VSARTSLQWSDGAAGPLLAAAERSAANWRDFAECQYTDAEAFFIEKGGNPEPAKRVCRSCPSRLPCLEFALENYEKFGIWGGLSEQQRRAVLKRGLTAAEAIAEDDERRMSKAQKSAEATERWRARERARLAETYATLTGSSAPVTQLRGEGGQFLTQVSAANAA
jgi:transcription factor WhiB